METSFPDNGASWPLTVMETTVGLDLIVSWGNLDLVWVAIPFLEVWWSLKRIQTNYGT